MKFYAVLLLAIVALVAFAAAEDIDPVKVEAKAQNSESAAIPEGEGKVPPKLQKRGLYGWGWGPGWGWGGYGWGHPGYYGWGGGYGYGWGWGGFFY